jgi:NADH:ubiquinone oxidoreductase subunit F (NADH-binding)/NAD-dependent dihydropyrimidine dehydrogenase PreA subunit/(2Fe-2S) ferredoxin
VNKSIEIKVCTGIGGVAAGGEEVFSAFREALSSTGIDAALGDRCSAHKVGCKGLCARDVLVDIVIDGDKTTYQYVKPHMVERIIREHVVDGNPVAEWIAGDGYEEYYAKQHRVVLSGCGEADPEDIDTYVCNGGFDGLRKALVEMAPEEIIRTVKDSHLRGRGGAGFPAGLKWERSFRVRSDVKYVVCNGDEGDPGTFKDRALMEGEPYAVIEGMIICAKAIGSHSGYIYSRGAYTSSVKHLQTAIDRCYKKGFLGRNILGSGFDFDLRLFKSAGAFVCGEATALLHTIEGKRSMPTPKFWSAAEKGLWDMPTVVNNVETFASIPGIILKGASWYRNLGVENNGGTKVFALTGKVKNTGLIEVRFGTPLREIIFGIGGGIEGGRRFKALHIGGPSGGCISEESLDVEIDYEQIASAGAIMGSGGLIVLDENDCMVNTAKYFLEFTQAESCGKCTPCRVGTKRMLEIMERITAGKGRQGDIELLEELGQYMKATSLCGLGMTAPNPVLSTIRYFRYEYEAHVQGKKCPAGVCKALITFTILEDICKGCGSCKRACPADAIRGTRKTPHRIDPGLCIKCGSCFEACKFKAILRV